MRRRLWVLITVVTLVTPLLTVPSPSLAQHAVMSFLTGATPNVTLDAGVETLVWNFDVYPPASPRFQSSQYVLVPWQARPAGCVPPIDSTRCPDHWSVLLLLTPVTLYNDSDHSGVVTITVYSDNAYVYQQRATVPSGAYVPIYFSTLSLGYIMNSAPDFSMPIRVTLKATVHMTLLRDTGEPGGLQWEAPRVWGAMVELRPM